MFAPFFNYFISGDTPDFGDAIGQSLRFIGGGTSPTSDTYLSRDLTPNTTFTLSVWLKLDVFELYSAYMGDYSSGSQFIMSGAGSVANCLDLVLSGTNLSTGTIYLRDPSAWYHFVITSDATTNRSRVYKNGVDITTGTPAAGSMWVTSTCYIGNMGPGGGGWTFRGYAADQYYIDGQSLPPTDFGRFNDDGVWVPKDPELGTAAVYSSFLDCSPGTWGPTYPPIYAFDGNLSTFATPATSISSPITFTPASPISFTSKLEVYVDANMMATWDGTTVGPGAATGWLEVATGSGEISKAKPLVLTIVNSYSNVYAIRVDGEILIDQDIWSNFLASSNGFDPSNPASYAFDGTTATASSTPIGAATNTFAPTTAIPFSTSLEVSTGQTDNSATFDGNTVALTDNVWATVYNGSGEISTTTPLVISSTGNGVAIRGIRVDGAIIIDGSNPTWGANGFHLTFADPSDVGKDYSGNNNDFTATGFDTTSYASGQFVHDDVAYDTGTNTVPTGGTEAPYFIDIVDPQNTNKWASFNPTGAFNGEVSGTGNSDGTYLYGSNSINSCNELTFDLRDFPTVTNCAIWAGWNQSDGTTSSAKVYLLDSSKNEIAGTNVTPVRVGNSCQRLEMCSTDVGARYIKFDLSAANSYFFLWGIEVNKQLLSQEATTAPTYDLMQDSPTQNYATFNPLECGGQTTNFGVYQNANLESASAQTASGMFPVTIQEDSQYYFEFTCTSGIATASAPGLRNAVSGQAGSRLGANSFYYRADGNIVEGSIVNAGGAPLATGATWAIGDVLGTAFDFTTNRLRFYKNGVEQCDITLTPTEPLQFSAYNDGGSVPAVNFGQQPFQYTPPEGYKALQTQNLPEPTIPDGSKHFQAITGPGASGNVQTVVYGADISTLPAVPYEATDDGAPATNAQLLGYPEWLSSGFVNNVRRTNLGGYDDWYIPAIDEGNEIWQLIGRGIADASRPTIFKDAGDQRLENGTYWSISQAPSAKNQLLYLNTTGTNTASGNYRTVGSYYLRVIRKEPSVAGRTIGDAVGGGFFVTTYNGNDLIISPRDGGEYGTSGILSVAQATFPSGLWWIKDMVNANNHQLVDSVRGVNQAVILPGSGLGEIAYVPPAGDSVAWCWSVDGPTSANNDGSIETQVAVNSEAGFSIITYTGDGGAASTIGHGLGAVPEFYGVWCRTAGQSLLATARHQDLTNANKVLFLTATNGETDYAVFGGVLPTDSVITVQGNLANNTNGNNLDFVMYAWTSIPGYSAFGSYTGNYSKDGPFVYLGFKPAFVMTKTIGTTPWMIYDSTRSPYNPCINILYPNTTAGDTGASGAGEAIDFLSNGFKLRGQTINNNPSGVEVIYAAFASNPFGGSNVAPVTAR